MRTALPARRTIALIAAYVVALQALLLPLSVAAGGPLQASLCSGATGGPPATHGTNCPCAAGCGMQCHLQTFVGSPQIIVAYLPTRAVVIVAAPGLNPVVRPATRRPQIPRAPPAA